MKLTNIDYGRRKWRIYLNPGDIKVLGLQGFHRVTLSFGVRRAQISLVADKRMKAQCICLSQNLKDELLLPEGLPLELVAQGHRLTLGPLVGLLLHKSGKAINKRMLTIKNTYVTKRLGRVERHTPIGLWGYVENYPQLGGVLLAFALDQMDQQKCQIQGHVFNPERACWQEMTLPYPSVIYRKIGLNEENKAHFVTALGEHWFNNYFADKWEVANWLMEEPGLREYLPETRLYRSMDDIESLIQKHHVIYAKPISGLGGFGVARLDYYQGQFRMQYRLDGVNSTQCFERIEDAQSQFENLCDGRQYLVQQGVELLRYEGGLLDLRILVQKNQQLQWQCQGIVIRQGVEGSVVSNISSDGLAWSTQELFAERLGYDSVQIRHLEARLYALALSICHRLDKCGISLAYVGVDLALDSSQRLWIIEVNMRDPDSTIALDINDRELYHRLKIGPLLYGRGLQGFGERLPD